MSDFEIASWMRNREIDIAVDLMGFTGHCRSGIFSHRPAPVQVNFLGFPGSLGAPYFDYIIADPVVIPADHERYYAEKTVLLPNCYLPADPARLQLASAPRREAVGLPAGGIVFASFNNSYKFSPAVFACWMRILQAIEGSVLWLSQNNPGARANLLREAAVHGVEPGRLLFAPPIPAIDEHLARLSLADIFLDTSPYNSHSTTIDALSAGVPLITTPGNSFASRVAASCLHAVGLPELVTHSLDDYQNLAVALAQNRNRLLEIRNRLAANIRHSSFFDVQKFTRDLETSFVTMWQRGREGASPASFTVPD
jgi:predicted O-linked N-acetylglucosamine transferase (SPINDLY family)